MWKQGFWKVEKRTTADMVPEENRMFWKDKGKAKVSQHDGGLWCVLVSQEQQRVNLPRVNIWEHSELK